MLKKKDHKGLSNPGGRLALVPQSYGKREEEETWSSSVGGMIPRQKDRGREREAERRELKKQKGLATCLRRDPQDESERSLRPVLVTGGEAIR